MVVRMAMTGVWFKIDEEHVVQAFQAAGGKLDSVEGEVVLDLSSVRRIDPNVLRAMEEFARIADGKGVKVVLRGVSVEVYKVLKVARLAQRFSFAS
jgi:anti-anti-sigma regulatory factor